MPTIAWGHNATKQGNLSEAYDALNRASQLLPNNLEVKGQFADFCLENYLKNPTRPQKLYQQIQQVSSDLLARNPNSFDGLRLKGYLAYADRKPQEAIAYFRKAVQIQPGSAPVTTALVETLNASGQPQEAEKIALDLLARHKDYGPIYDALARIYSNANRPADAEKALRSKADNNPRNPDYIVETGHALPAAGNTAEMKNALQRMLNDPKSFPNAQMRVATSMSSRRSTRMRFALTRMCRKPIPTRESITRREPWPRCSPTPSTTTPSVWTMRSCATIPKTKLRCESKRTF